MSKVGDAWADTTPPMLTFRPSLHSIEQIVHALVPYYGLNHPIAAISTDPLQPESCIEATLGSISALLMDKASFRRPVLIIK